MTILLLSEAVTASPIVVVAGGCIQPPPWATRLPACPYLLGMPHPHAIGSPATLVLKPSSWIDAQ